MAAPSRSARRAPATPARARPARRSYSGGGVALGPKPRKYDQKTPKKMISLALRSALSDRANEGKVVVVDSWGWDTPSTKAATKALAGLGIDGRVLVVVGRDDAAAALSFRNLPEVQLIAPAELNAYDVLCNDWIVFTQDVAPHLQRTPPQSRKQLRRRVERRPADEVRNRRGKRQRRGGAA